MEEKEKEKLKLKQNTTKKHKKKLAFTLIELLAVIIILGILMIIAIPSVTEYIQTARKDSYIKTASQYIADGRNKVNSAQLPMYDTSTTYYVPISCMSLEKGGDSPFGEFEDAYVVVTYDGSGYDYYWTSRDSSNMGILLTYEGLLNSESIKSGITSISTDIGVGDRENIILVGDDCKVENGANTAANTTITEKGKLDANTTPGDNFKVEATHTIMSGSSWFDSKLDYNMAKKIESIEIKNTNVPAANAIDKWDVSASNDGSVMAWYTDADENGKYELYVGAEGGVLANQDSSYMFNRLSSCVKYDLKYLDTSNVTNMYGIFSNASSSNDLADSVTLSGVKYWDTSKVTTMANAFSYFGTDVKNVDISEINSWDTSNVTSLSQMFYMSGFYAENYIIGDLSKWNTSKVTDMSNMFRDISAAKNVVLTGINKWDTSSVTDMNSMFQLYCEDCDTVELDLTGWNTSKVTNMSAMFSGYGAYANSATLKGLENWNTSSLQNAGYLFSNISLKEIDLSSWDTSKVTSMSGMFYICDNLTKIYVGEKFTTNNVTSSSNMFYSCYNLSGENGTAYNSSYQDKTYARIDKASTPGYFSTK